MRTVIEYIDAETGGPSHCGEALDITVSSRDLGWDGVLVEKGSSPHFYPENVRTPYFYFALALEADLKWKARHGDEFVDLLTHPDEIWINPPGTPFSHRIDEPCRFTIVAVDEPAMYRSFSGAVQDGSLDFLNNYNIVDPTLRNIIETLGFEAESGGRNGPAFVDGLLRVFAEHFIRNYSNLDDVRGSSKGSGGLSESDLVKIDAFFDEHVDESLSLDAAASLVNMSLFHFLREFKKSRGITPHQYLIRRKVERARTLLRKRDLSIQQVAYSLGFSDQSHFSRTFRKIVGTSPREFRKRAGALG